MKIKKINAANNQEYLEQIIFEINYNTGTWKKLRRKRQIEQNQINK